jgi:hypothetical protein
MLKKSKLKLLKITAAALLLAVGFWANLQWSSAQSVVYSCPLRFYEDSPVVNNVSGATTSGSTTCTVPAGADYAEVLVSSFDDGGTVSVNGSVVSTFDSSTCGNKRGSSSQITVTPGEVLTFSATSVNCGVGGTGISAQLDFYGSTAPPPSGVGPIGWIDFGDCSNIDGWTLDLDTPSVSINVELYDGPKGGGTFLGTYPTDILRSDINSNYGATGNHGFSIDIPATIWSGSTHSLHVYGINSDGSGTDTLLAGSPVTVFCQYRPPPPPPPPYSQGTYYNQGAYTPPPPAYSQGAYTPPPPAYSQGTYAPPPAPTAGRCILRPELLRNPTGDYDNGQPVQVAVQEDIAYSGNCSGFTVELRAGGSSFGFIDWDAGTVIGTPTMGPCPAWVVAGGGANCAVVCWNAHRFGSYDTYGLRGVVGTGSGTEVSEAFSSTFDITLQDAQMGCGVSNPPAPPPSNPGSGVSIGWQLINPLAGSPQPQDIFGLIVLISTWILNILGSLIVILIIYAGIRFMLSRGNPGEIQKAKAILKWALVGFAITLIGKGFVFLVDSVLRGQFPTF